MMKTTRKEKQALDALVALALQNDSAIVSDIDIARYISGVPVELSEEDMNALNRSRPKFFEALRSIQSSKK